MLQNYIYVVFIYLLTLFMTLIFFYVWIILCSSDFQVSGLGLEFSPVIFLDLLKYFNNFNVYIIYYYMRYNRICFYFLLGRQLLNILNEFAKICKIAIKRSVHHGPKASLCILAEYAKNERPSQLCIQTIPQGSICSKTLEDKALSFLETSLLVSHYKSGRFPKRQVFLFCNRTHCRNQHAPEPSTSPA